MDYLRKAGEFVAGCYGFTIDSIVDHPHMTFWSGVFLIVLALVL